MRFKCDERVAGAVHRHLDPVTIFFACGFDAGEVRNSHALTVDQRSIKSNRVTVSMYVNDLAGELLRLISHEIEEVDVAVHVVCRQIICGVAFEVRVALADNDDGLRSALLRQLERLPNPRQVGSVAIDRFTVLIADGRILPRAAEVVVAARHVDRDVHDRTALPANVLRIADLLRQRHGRLALTHRSREEPCSNRVEIFDRAGSKNRIRGHRL